ncbi:MAG: hypothetical protein R3Y63_15310 [Eubacteriales bacterium]
MDIVKIEKMSKEVLEEVINDLKSGVLEEDEKIQILRTREPLPDTKYFPIIEWFYTEEVMNEHFEELEYYSNGEPKDIELNDELHHYDVVKSSLKSIKASNCVEEIESHFGKYEESYIKKAIRDMDNGTFTCIEDYREKKATEE